LLHFQYELRTLIWWKNRFYFPQSRKNRKGILIQFPKVSEDTDLSGGTGFFPRKAAKTAKEW
jgi:hypothetical protein